MDAADQVFDGYGHLGFPGKIVPYNYMQSGG
jgi:hypothetical protein